MTKNEITLSLVKTMLACDINTGIIIQDVKTLLKELFEFDDHECQLKDCEELPYEPVSDSRYDSSSFQQRAYEDYLRNQYFAKFGSGQIFDPISRGYYTS